MAQQKAPVNEPNKKQLKGLRGAAKDAMKWFAQQEKDVRKRSRQTSFHSRPNIGQMYVFAYDPKWKDKLPYYDRSPLIFPIRYYKNGFLGINLHYLHPRLREKLLEELVKRTVGVEGSVRRRLKISYRILAGASELIAFQPCVKRYLYSHVRSRFARIPESQWDEAIWLPLAKFTKASAAEVWRDSAKRI